MTVDEDYVVCGSCEESFPLDRMKLFLNHKRFDCDDKPDPGSVRKQLWCGSCLERFDTPWSLLQHAQSTHALRVYLHNNLGTLTQTTEPNIGSIKAQQAKISELQANLVALQEEINNIAQKQTASQRHQSGTLQTNLSPPGLTINQLADGRRSASSSLIGSNLKPLTAEGSSLAESCGGTVKAALGKPARDIQVLAEKHNVPVEIVKNILDMGGVADNRGGVKQFQIQPNIAAPIVKSSNVVAAPRERLVSGGPKEDQNLAATPRSLGQNLLSLPRSDTATVAPVWAGIGQSVFSIATPKVSTARASSNSGACAVMQLSPSDAVGSSTQQVKSTTLITTTPITLQSKPVVSILKRKSSVPMKVPRVMTSSTRGASATSSQGHVNLENRGATSSSIQGRPGAASSPEVPIPVEEMVPAKKNSSCENIGVAQPNAQDEVRNTEDDISAEVTTRPSAPDEVVSGGPSGGTQEAAEDSTPHAQCCDDQDCGVTVMPGTHEKLQECCNAVVPKKRKRHMETKHWSFLKSARRRYATKMPVKKSAPASSTASETSTIYIDVEHVNPPQQQTMQQHHPSGILFDNRETQKSTTVSSGVALGFDGDVTTLTSATVRHLVAPPNMVQSCTQKSKSSASQSQRSVIIPAGATFSIPLTYSSPSDASATPPRGSLGALGGVPLGVMGVAPVNVKREEVEEDDIEMMRMVKQEEMSYADLADIRQKRRRYPTSRPFKCDECEHSFNQRIHLRKHKSKHTGIKPFKCEQCDYSTVERSHLKVHIRVHTGEKPYKCTYCEYATAQNSTLKIHLKRHHSTLGRSRGGSRPSHTQSTPTSQPP